MEGKTIGIISGISVVILIVGLLLGSFLFPQIIERDMTKKEMAQLILNNPDKSSIFSWSGGAMAVLTAWDCDKKMKERYPSINYKCKLFSAFRTWDQMACHCWEI